MASIYSSIIGSLELDKSLNKNLLENAEFGETPESGTAKTAKFKKEDGFKCKEKTVEEITKDAGNGKQEYGAEPSQSEPSTGKLEENATEDKWDATEIDRRGFKALLKFNFGADANGNNYIIVNDGNEVERLSAKDDAEAKMKFNKIKEDEEADETEEKIIEPSTIVIDNDSNEVTITFNEEPSEKDVEEAVKKFCGEEFFATLEPVADETDKLVYHFTVKEMNKDEDLFAEADSIETPEE